VGSEAEKTASLAFYHRGHPFPQDPDRIDFAVVLKVVPDRRYECAPTGPRVDGVDVTGRDKPRCE
jgi:hypothetical protein